MSKTMRYRMPEIEQNWRDTMEFLGEAEDLCRAMTMQDIFDGLGQPVKSMLNPSNHAAL